MLPLAETATGSPWLLHTLLGAAALLGLVMAATAGPGSAADPPPLARGAYRGSGVFGRQRVLVARRLVLVAPGRHRGVGQGLPPELDRPLGVILALEAVGLAALAWLARRHGLTDRSRLRALWATGRLPRPAR